MSQCRVIVGDCIEQLRLLPAESVHCCVTSPPYYGLRHYGIAPSVWADGWRGVLGSEPTPALFAAHMVEVFREVRRVLRKDGTIWCNLGDSFASSGGPPQGLQSGDMIGIPWMIAFALQADGWILRRDVIWEKPNPMPESVSGWSWQQHRVKSGKRIPADWKALPKGWDVGEGSHDAVPAGNYRTNGDREATTAEMIDCPGCKKCEPNGGLVLRKGNWRCTTSHEYIFQFAKSDSYFCDGEAAKERTTGQARSRRALQHRNSGGTRSGSR